MSSLGVVISRIVETHTHGDHVDIRAVARELGCVFGPPFDDSTLRGRLRYISDQPGVMAEFNFNKKNTVAENNTITALLLAELILSIETMSNKLFKCDVFFMTDMRQWRSSAQMMLATRLAIPQHIFAALNDINFRSAAYALQAQLMPVFVNSATFITEGMSLFGFLSQNSTKNNSAGIERLPENVRKNFAPQGSTVRTA